MTPSGTKSDVPPAPINPAHEGPEAEKAREIMAAVETAVLNDPAQRLSPLHDNEPVFMTMPGLTTKMVDAGPTVGGYRHFGLAVRGSRKRVLDGLKNRTPGGAVSKDAKAQRANVLIKAMIEAAQEMAEDMKDLPADQGIDIRISVDPRPGAFSTNIQANTYTVNLPRDVDSLEALEELEDKQRDETREDQKKRADEVAGKVQAQKLGEAILNVAGVTPATSSTR